MMSASPPSVTLTIVAGPGQGSRFVFDRHDTFLVGRSNEAHLRLPADDPYCSRQHFLIEVNPPRCRLFDLNSHNGTYVNGARVGVAELRDGDEVRAGHTSLRVDAPGQLPAPQPPGRQDVAAASPGGGVTVVTTDHVPPLHVPGYALQGELGRGGMGVVYRARCLADGSSVAVKTIAPCEGTPRKRVELFLREASILRELDHPNVVRFRDQGEHAGVLYLVMDLVSGSDAATLLHRDGPWPVRTAVRMVWQVLKGLAHAHARNFVHRDVKPSNLLIEEAPPRRTAKLADFGLARVVAGAQISGVTMHGEVSGTIGFMAPEQITHLRTVTPLADLYSTAAALYHLLTARLPHDLPPEPMNRLVHILTNDAVPIRERRADVPAGLADVIARGLARDPAARFPDAEAFRAALRPFAA
jgi:serine/threonine-protein kinase